MANLMAGSINGRFPELSLNERLEVMSVLINNACNLSCKHCYLQTRRFGTYLDPQEWMQFFSSVFGDVKPTILSFAGKEVFINQKSVSLLLDAIRLRNDLQASSERKTEIGVITNGTLLGQYKDQLTDVFPDFMDISIDGLPEIHDEVRGQGAFAQLAPNLDWLMQACPEKIWVTHTSLESNLTSLPSFIEFYHEKFGLRQFSIGFYKDRHYTDTTLKLEENHYLKLVDEVMPQLESLSLSSPVEIIMEIDTTQMGLMKVLTDNGWANPVDKVSSVSHHYRNGLTIRVNTARVSTNPRAVRITPEGFWLPAESLIYVRQYLENKIANVRDFGFDAGKLYQHYLQRLEITEKNAVLDIA